MARKPALGRGLSSLIGDVRGAGGASIDADDRLTTLPIEKLQPGKYQPRSHIDSERLAELADSIKAQGLIQPIIVRAVGGGRHEIIAGERRWRASQLAGLDRIPVIIREVADNAAIAMALIENIQRENLNPLEESRALQRLIQEFELTHQQAAEAVGRSRAAVSNLLRLLELADEVKALLEAGKLEMGHARALLALGGNDQIHTARQVVARGLSVRETEKLVKRLVTGAARPPAPPRRIDPDIRRLEEELAEHLGAKVALDQGRGGKGRLVISYNSLDELDGILERIRSGREA